MASEPVSADGVTRVGPGRGERVLVWGGFPLAGALVGGLAWLLADWLDSVRWRPVRGLFKLVDFLPDPVGLVGLVVIGAVVGVLVALTAEGEYVTVEVTDDQVVCTRDGDSRTVPRACVSGVFMDDGRLVLLGHEAEELAVYSAREGADLPDAERLAAAFLAHGYPWLPDGDPHGGEYRRWVPDAPGLPPGADAFLNARDRALRNGDKEEAGQLREELGRLGVVVRDDEKKRQFWRHAGRPLDR